MKLLTGALIGASIVVALTHWRKPIAWVLTRIPPDTHPDCAPRYRTCHEGAWTEGPWDA